MRTALVILVCLGIAVPAAHAGPPALVIDEKDVSPAFRTLVERLEEPVGMLAPADVAKLGLVKGDLVRSVNGLPANTSALIWEMMGATTLYLDVLRGKKPVTVVVSIKLGAQELTFERDKVKDMIARLRSGSSSVRQVTRKGVASGVMASTELFGFVPFMHDTIVRAINGKPIATSADVLAALEAGIDQPSIRFGLERNDQAFTFTIVLEEPPLAAPDELEALIKKVKKVNDTTYEIPAELREAILANPMAIAKGARVVPAVKDGKGAGFKLYAIRPGSLYTALGLTNGDTLVSVDGQLLDSADKALEVYTQVRKAKQLKVEILRRGKPINVTYTFK